jgi:outer membrane lipoprotein-sorting protein
VLVGDDDEPEPTSSDATVRLWIERPTRFREEYEGAWGDQTAVCDGQALWRRVPRLGVLHEDITDGAGSLFAALLIDPAPLLPGLELELLDETHHAGRVAHRVRGLPNRVFWHDLFGLAPGADEYALLIDAERGILLRAAALLEGDEFSVSEVEEVAFDEDLPPDLFVLELARGERVRTHEDLAQDFPDEVTLEEAVRRASFTVWVPQVRRGWQSEVVHYGRGSEDYPTPETVDLHYFGKKGQLSIHETARDEKRGRNWEPVSRDGHEYRVWNESERPHMPTLVRLHKGDTSIEFQSGEVGRDELLKIASSLEPAAGQ